jgi:hypothetical protein
LKIVRTPNAIDPRNAAIDGFDMYLLSRLEEPMSLDQLLEITPCDAAKAMQRIARLAELGLVELHASVAEPLPLRRSLPPDENMPTLRPVPLARTKLVAARQGAPFRDVGRPPPRQISEEAVTLRPPPPPTPRAQPFGEEPSTGVRCRPFAFVPDGAKKRGTGTR